MNKFLYAISTYCSTALTIGVLSSHLLIAQTPPLINQKSSPKSSISRINQIVETRYCKQTRYGRYQVLAPSNMPPAHVYPLVLLLHGNGNSPELMIEWARQLEMDSVIFICPEAPYIKAAETIDSKKERFSAMPDAIGAPAKMTPDAISLSCEWYYDVVRDAQLSLQVDRSIKPVVIGFSQGGFYSHVLATRHPDAFGGIVSICASMYPDGHVAERYVALVPYKLEFLVAHGIQDPIVPIATGEQIHHSLQMAGVQHEFVPFTGGHWPTNEVSVRIREWVWLKLRTTQEP